ncbi:MAG: MarR family transcriptional regulator [Elusimicrobia bacterium]|nr:MarR family transcriptional regulator [Elusimicrobiota bacterium]
MPTKYRGTPDETRALSALINLLRASEAFNASLQREAAAAELSASQFGVLEALLHLGPTCQGELAVKLLRSGGSLTSVVAGLERRGLVERRREGSDKRYVTVRLTAKGERLIAGIFPTHARTVARQFRALTAPEQDELRRLCRKLGRSLEPG